MVKLKLNITPVNRKPTIHFMEIINKEEGTR